MHRNRSTERISNVYLGMLTMNIVHLDVFCECHSDSCDVALCNICKVHVLFHSLLRHLLSIHSDRFSIDVRFKMVSSCFLAPSNLYTRIGFGIRNEFILFFKLRKIYSSGSKIFATEPQMIRTAAAAGVLYLNPILDF